MMFDLVGAVFGFQLKPSKHQTSPAKWGSKPPFDQFVGERQGNERFDAQNKFKLVYLFDSSHPCHSGL
jgi:hypothetical protein